MCSSSDFPALPRSPALFLTVSGTRRSVSSTSTVGASAVYFLGSCSSSRPVCSSAGSGWLPINTKTTLGKHVVGGAGFISNLLLVHDAGYFGCSAKFKPLLHLWSLGIEEQFYLIWPAVLFALRGRRFATAFVDFVLAAAPFCSNLQFHDQQSHVRVLPAVRPLLGADARKLPRIRQSPRAMSPQLRNLEAFAGSGLGLSPP